MRHYGTILFLMALLLPVLGKSQKISEEQLKKELQQLQVRIDSTGIVSNTVQELERNYKIAKKNKYDAAFLIGAELVRTYSALDNAGKVIEVSTDLENTINKNSPPYDVSNMYRMKARSLGDLGFLEDSHKAYLASRRYIEKIKNNDARHYYGSLFYSGYSSYFDQSKKQSDSVRLCLIKGLDEAEKISDKSDLISQNQKYDLIASIQGNLTLYHLWILKPAEPKTAEKYLLKSLRIAETKEINPFNEMNLYRTAGDFYFDQKDNDKAILYAQKGLDLERKISSPSSREIFYEVLMEAYLAKNNSVEGKKYSLLLTKLKDSIKTAEKHSVNKVTNAIKKEKDMEQKSNITNLLLIFSGIVLILALAVWYFWKRDQKIKYAKYEKIISQLNNQEKDAVQDFEEFNNKNVPKEDRNINIHDETAAVILQKLKRFEKSGKFLKNDITLSSLSTSLDTNPRYLSEIIKQYTGKNFNNYLNGLRIQNIIQLLYKEPVYREYKITYLAEYSGFASTKVFATAFKKETGVTPSYFINQLKEEAQ